MKIRMIRKNCCLLKEIFSVKHVTISSTPCCDKSRLANEIGSFFVKKITDICRDLDSDKDKNTPKLRGSSTSVSSQCSISLREFELLDEVSVRKLNVRAPTKSCSLEPVTKQLQQS